MIGLFTLPKYSAHLHQYYCEWKSWVNCKYLSYKSQIQNFSGEKKTTLTKQNREKNPIKNKSGTAFKNMLHEE